jgi:hypothetical protein
MPGRSEHYASGAAGGRGTRQERCVGGGQRGTPDGPRRKTLSPFTVWRLGRPDGAMRPRAAAAPRTVQSHNFCGYAKQRGTR